LAQAFHPGGALKPLSHITFLGQERRNFSSMMYLQWFTLMAQILLSAGREDHSSLVLLQVQEGTMLISEQTHKPKQSTVPRMIMQRGCTCSSTVMQYTRALLQTLNVPLYNLRVKELLRTVHIDQNPWFQEGDDVVMALQRGLNDTAAHGQGLLFNNFKLTQGEQQRSINQMLISHGTRTVIVHRANALDTLICEVRDCFKGINEPERGYPVDLEGKYNDLCFLRRGADGGGVKTKAVINTTNMMGHMHEAEVYAKQQKEMVSKLGYQEASIVTVEDLLAHEYSAEKVHTSYKAWMSLLRSLGVNPQRRAVMKFLLQRVGSYSPPEPHGESVWNVDAVKAELEKNNKMGLWRS